MRVGSRESGEALQLHHRVRAKPGRQTIFGACINLHFFECLNDEEFPAFSEITSKKIGHSVSSSSRVDKHLQLVINNVVQK